MSRRLPPLNQLRAFEAAARHLSFKAAAEELNVTHAAVSHQIKALEESLGTQVFQRVTRGVRLSAEAQRLSTELSQAFDQMDQAIQQFKAKEMTGTLKVSVVPWYGNRLILPRLAEFRADYPGLTVDLGYSYELVDFSYSDFQAALRHGKGNWPNLSEVKVHSDTVSPIAAPALVEGLDLPLSSERISQMTLAVARGQEDAWRYWLEQAGVADATPTLVKFDNRALTTEFAIAGNGVALSDLRAIDLELQTATLVRLHPLAVTLDSGLHLVFPETPYPDPRLLAFAEWLKVILSTKSPPD